MATWPLFRENLLQGPSHVSLALLGKPSAISESVGGTQPALLLIPNLDYLQSFIKGNVGIGDSILKNGLLTNLNSPLASNNEMLANNLIKANNLDIDVSKYKKPDGSIKIPSSAINLPPSYDSLGLKAMEKTIMTSIFETQKPYLDVAKIVLGTMVKVEDIIARVMPLLSLNPLTSKSEKPIHKDGTSNGTKAIGYKNGQELNNALAQLDKLSKIGGTLTINNDGTTTKTNVPNTNASTDNPDLSDADAAKQGKHWQIISTVYSTGAFDPSVNYLYSYNILPEDDQGPNNLTPDNTTTEPDNPQDKYKPKRIIMGIFKADGTPLDPNENLKTIAFDGTSISKADTPFKKADWVLKSPKWVFNGNDYVWPSFGGSSGQPIYMWESKYGNTQESKTSPGDKWTIKKYKKGDKNIITKIDAIEGDPMITKFDTTDTGEFANYFKDFIKNKTNQSDLEQTEKDSIVNDITNKLDIQSHLQNVFLYGSGNSVYKTQGIPDAIKKSFKPYKITANNAINDPKLAGDGKIWIDPESDYEFKIIRVDPITKIDYKDPKGETNISADVKSYIKNSIIFTTSDNSKFDITIKRNGVAFDTQKGITEYSIDNWNFENSNIINTNYFNITIINQNGTTLLDNKLYDASNLPSFSKQITISFNSNGNQTLTTKDIPLYNVKVTNPNSEYETIIDPSAIKNDFLATDQLFSKGSYGNGTKDNPQEIEVIKRYALTDLDTESYYIIEGVAVDDNSNNNKTTAPGEDGSKWYRLPHAIGATTVFLAFLVEISIKLFPSINKLLKLFSNPTSFVTDIISDKAGDSFSIFSKQSFKTITDTKKIIDKKDDIISKGRTSDYSDKIKRNFNISPLVKHVSVDRFSSSNPGKFKFLMDGAALIPFEIFGKSMPFGMQLKMSNLIPDTSKTTPTSPFKLVLGKPGLAKTKDCDSSNTTPQPTGQSNNDYLNSLNNPTTTTNKNQPTTNPNDKYVTQTWYSTGQFIKGVDYNYIYVNDDTERLLEEVDKLINPNGNITPGSGQTNANNPDITPVPMEDLQLAKEKVSNALSKEPDNQALKDKLKEINSKILDNASTTQPILKLVLGMVATPIKIISCIVKWIMDFFKSLINPMMLPAKIAELLSFKWIMSFFSPQGLLKTAGIDFNPNLAKDWVSAASIPNANNLNNLTNNNTNDILKNIKPHNGKYAIPDNFPLGDMSKILNISFLAVPPIYTAKTIRENPNLPSKLLDPILCFIEKLINAFIDFIWSTLGIEAVIQPPHIKLCRTKTPSDLNKLQNNQLPTEDQGTLVESTTPYQDMNTSTPFVYEVKLPNSKVLTLKNEEELQNYMDQNKNIGYDLNF